MLNNRQSSNRRRGRGRGPQGNGQRGNESRIDNRARGNAPQMLEKYKNMARDAQLQGDRVMTEYYLQFADHYFRIVAESRARFEETRQRREEWQGEEGFEGEMADDGQGAGGDYAAEDMDSGSGEAREARAPREDRGPRRDNGQRARRDGNRGDGNREDRPRGGYVNGNGHDDHEDATRPVLDAGVLPPAINISSEPEADVVAEEAPRRRGRPKRANPDAEAAE